MSRNRALVIDAKSGACVDCGGIFHYVCMDLDHVRGTKLFELGQAGIRSEISVKEEIMKCDAVCANCHRVRTFKELIACERDLEPETFGDGA